MPIKITSIEITDYGVNIIGDEVEILELADGTTRELKVRGYAAPCGINDGKDIGEHMTKIMGEAVALPLAERAVLQAERDQERTKRMQAETQREEIAQAYERVVREKEDVERNVAQLTAEMENRQRVTDAPAGSRDSV